MGTPPHPSDADVAWITGTLGLAPLDSPRRAFLDANSSIDVSACPGSGKTTLVVAKLGLLAKSWDSRSQGICVLSHTNVARIEIRERLGGTAVGGELLRYPHYIDTIHGFMNRFLAVPWLLSNNISVSSIDDDVVARVRRKFLGETDYRKLEGFLARKGQSVSGLRLLNANLDTPLGEAFPAGPHTAMYRLASSAVTDSARRGYFRHDEMFVFAQALLDEQPYVAAALRARFPFVLVDEMQDTTAEQNRLLDQLFPVDDEKICIQRVGDPNQAIYNASDNPGGPTFPRLGKTITLANSFRFDDSVARLADGFANDPVPDGLTGLRDSSTDASPAVHTIFLFDVDKIHLVLPTFASHVLASFSDELLSRSKVAAIGLVHKPTDPSVVPGHTHFPKTISHYWTSYQHTAVKRGTYFTSLLQYMRESQSIVERHGPTAAAVDLLATGLLRLANTLSPADELRIPPRPHMHLLRLIDASASARQYYAKIVGQYILGGEEVEKTVWTRLTSELVSIARAAGGGREASQDTTLFSAWSDPPIREESVATGSTAALNVQRVEKEGRHVDLFVGSIHSVKGETHLSTLVVETYANAHFFKALLPWLTGTKRHGTASLNAAQRGRLFSAYVAMTRATHLLCLAIPAASLGTGKKASDAEQSLLDAGWSIVRV